MPRFRGGSDDGADQQIDISPLIDCVFILLIFFIVTTTFIEEAGVQVEKPEAAAATTANESTTVTLHLTAKGDVLLDGRNVGVRGVRAEVKRALREDSEAPVVVQADADAPTRLLVQVVDEARLAGAEKVSLTARKPSA